MSATTPEPNGPSAWQVVRVDLVPPVAGRSGLRLSRGTEVVEFPFSYTPHDSVELLADAVDAVVASPGERRVLFSSGPDEYELVFVREADRVDVSLLSYPDHRRDRPGDQLLSLVLNPHLVGKLFWRALRQLQSQADPDAYLAAWHHPFPERAVVQLGSRLKE